MKQNKNNRFAALLLALCMAVCCALPALAAPAASANIDLSRTGSMDVTLYDHQNDVPLRGGALTVYKVADVARTNGDLHFVYTADFTGCGIALGDLTDSTLASRLEAKLPARAAGTTHKISEQGIRYSALPGHTAELAEALNQELSAKWSRLRGIEIVSLGVSGVKASEEDEQMIKELQRSAAFMDPTRAAAHLVGAQASAMQAAASNTAAGPAMAFMGMNQAAAAGGVNARDLYQMGGQQTAAQPQAAPAAGWTCSCGHTGNTGKFCAECGKPRPEAPAVWVCSCGAKNSGKFCSECGRPRPAAKCANCGFVPADPANPPKFCPECGKPFGA